MAQPQARWQDASWLIGLWALAVSLGLAGQGWLHYHEAFIAQGAIEMLASGNWAYPTIGAIPWLEKPPLPWWLVAALGWTTGHVSPLVSRIPSAIAALLLVVGTALVGRLERGPRVGILSGALQATTYWTVARGRLAEADIILACVICWAMVGLLLVRSPGTTSRFARYGRWLFMISLGVSSLVKGIGFGPLFVLLLVAGIALVDQDRSWLRKLCEPISLVLVLIFIYLWPLAMGVIHGGDAWLLWWTHSFGRFGGSGLASPFTGESWGQYIVGILGQALPWTPFAVWGAAGSLRRIRRTQIDPESRPGDHAFLLVWGFVPLVVLGCARARHAHYVIAAQIPWSIWAADVLIAIADRRRQAEACDEFGLRRSWMLGLTFLAGAYGLAFGWVVPRFDRRAEEWAFYQTLSPRRDEPVVFLYDEWDRLPYPSPFGEVPYDRGARLYYLGRYASWRQGVLDLALHPPERDVHDGWRETGPMSSTNSWLVIGRDRDLGELIHLGRLELVKRGPQTRWDRSFVAVRIHPGKKGVREGWLDETLRQVRASADSGPGSLRNETVLARSAHRR